MSTTPLKVYVRLADLLARIEANKRAYCARYDALCEAIEQHNRRRDDFLRCAAARVPIPLYRVRNYTSAVDALENPGFQIDEQQRIAMNVATFECLVLDRWLWSADFDALCTRFGVSK